MKNFIFALLCTTFATILPSIFADEPPEVYVHGFAGANYITTERVDGIKIDALPGYVMGTAIGLKFSSVRVEAEGAYRYNEFRESIPLGYNLFFDRGKTEKISFFVNFFYDFPHDLILVFLKPYLGVGFGQKVDIEHAKFKYFEFGSAPLVQSFNSKIYGVAGQIVAGIGLPMTERTITKVEYRFLKDADIESNHSFVLNIDWLF